MRVVSPGSGGEAEGEAIGKIKELYGRMIPVKVLGLFLPFRALRVYLPVKTRKVGDAANT